MNKELPCLIVSCLFSAGLAAGDSPFSTTLNAGLMYDDNLARASLSQDIVSDTIVNLGVGLSYSQHPHDHHLLVYSASIDTYQYQEFDKLSNFETALGIEYQIQHGHSFTAPWYLMSFDYRFNNYESRLRDSNGFKLELAVGKRLTDRLSLRSGLSHESIAADTDEFDIDNNRLYASIDYKLSNRQVLYFTLGFTQGQVATSTTDTTPASSKPSSGSDAKQQPVRQYAHHLPNEVGSGPLRQDDAFQNGFVYQLDTDILSLHLGDNYALSHDQSIDFSAFLYTADSFGDSDYDGIILQLSYLHRF